MFGQRNPVNLYS